MLSHRPGEKLPKGERQIPALGLCQGLEATQHVVRSLPGEQGPLGDGKIGIHRELFGKVFVASDARTVRTGPRRVVEGKEAVGDLRKGHVALRANEVLRQEALFFPLGQEQDKALALPEGRFHRLTQPGPPVLPGGKAVHHDLHGVLFVLVQGDLFFEPKDRAVHPHPQKTLLADLLEDVAVLPLFPPQHGAQDFYPFPVVVPQDQIHDLVQRVPGEPLTTGGACGHSDAAKEETKIVVDLGDRPHGGAGVVACGALLDGDSRRKAFNGFHIRLVHLTDKLSCVSG